jgi:hypothetical protein
MKRLISLAALPVLVLIAFICISNAETGVPAPCTQTICVTVDGEPADCKVKVYYDSELTMLAAECDTGDDGCCDVELSPGTTYYATAWCGAPVIAPFTACTSTPIVLPQ